MHGNALEQRTSDPYLLNAVEYDDTTELMKKLASMAA
jgi:hypothetical protein